MKRYTSPRIAVVEIDNSVILNNTSPLSISDDTTVNANQALGKKGHFSEDFELEDDYE